MNSNQKKRWELRRVLICLVLSLSCLIFNSAKADYVCDEPIIGDVNGPSGLPDCVVDYFDIAHLVNDWLGEGVFEVDFDDNGIVDFNDFMILSADWGADNLIWDGPWVLNTIDNSSSGADGVRLADVNGDTLQDIATGWEEGGLTRVYLNPGDAEANEPWPGVTVGQTTNVEDAVFIDLDGDGATDVISSCEGSTKKLYMHWAPQNPSDYLDQNSWQTESIPQADGLMGWMFAVGMDVDGSNGIDIVAGGKGTGSQIGWFEAPANPRQLGDFQWHQISTSGWIMSIIKSDMDNDGDLDIAITDRTGDDRGCRWLENPGPGPGLYQPWTNHFIGGVDKQVMFMKFGDLDQDGLEDIVVAVASLKKLLYLRRLDATGLSWDEYLINLPDLAGRGKAVAIGDIDEDGRKDIVFTCELAEDKFGVGWLSYINAPTDPDWEHHDISGTSVGIKYDRIELLDLDGDSDLDVLTCEERQGGGGLGVIWYENPLR